MSFLHPGVAIFAAALLPAVFGALRITGGLHRRAAFAYSHLTFLTTAVKAPVWPAIALDAVTAAAYTLLVLATAQPRYVQRFESVGTIVICIDTSGSMRSRDLAPSRAEAASRAMRSFAGALPPGTRLGIVAFAETARIVTAPTADRAAVMKALALLPRPNGPTAIGDALHLASTLLPARGPRAVLLITDGTNNRGQDPGRVARELARVNVRLAVIAVGGSREAAPSVVRLGRTEEIPAAALRMASEMTTASRPLDCTEPCELAGVFLLTAAWVASQRGAFRF